MIQANDITKTKVVIVGAGPTGLSLAAQLLRYNIDFIIIEKNEKTTHLSKAVVVQARTMEILMEMGLAQKAIETGRITTAMNIFHNGKRKAFLDLAGMGDGLSPFPFVLSLEQSKTEKLLADHLTANGKTINWGSELINFEQNNGVTVHYKDKTGIEQTIKAEYIVGCDGAGSMIRHQMGAGFEGDTIPKIFYVADVEMSSPLINTDQLFIFLIKKGFILFFPMEGKDHYRVIGILPDKKEDDRISFEDIEGFVQEQSKVPVSFDKVRWFSSYKVHSRKANTFMNDRCFIAGDAAHIHTPAGGQGMNTGIQDAYNLAWKLAYVIDHKMSAAVLDTYNTERMENAAHLLKTTDRMFDFMTGSGGLWNFIRLNIFPLVARFISGNSSLNKRFFPLLSQIGIAYPHSTLTRKSAVGKVEAGQRVPYFKLPDGKNIFDHLTKPCFKLLYFGNNKTAFRTADNFPFEIEMQQFDEIPAAVFGDHSNFYVLIRPDNHISWIGKDLKNAKELLVRMKH